jgi:osmotically-inducible protein OsmY
MAPLSEELMKQDIVDQLTWDDSVNANAVHIDVMDNTVRLTGKVPNYLAKMAAERDAYQVAGVANVENYLEVEFPPAITRPTDEEIISNVGNMLLWDSKTDSSNILLKCHRGVVTLSGSVNTYWEKYRAWETAVSAKGVIDVVNNLSVKYKKTILDTDIERDIKNSYRRSALIDENKIEVNVKNGIVHLEGVVSHYLIKNQAYEIAMYTSGVVDVVSNITID